MVAVAVKIGISDYKHNEFIVFSLTYRAQQGEKKSL